MKYFKVWLKITRSYNSCYCSRYTDKVIIEAETADEACKKAIEEKREFLKKDCDKTHTFRVVAMDCREI